MKKLALLLPLVFVAGLSAEEPKKEVAKAGEKAVTVKTHEVQAEVVSVAPDGKSLTIKSEKGDKTVPVDEKAATAVKALKPGDKTTLICRDSEAGEHQAVTGIKPAEKKY